LSEFRFFLGDFERIYKNTAPLFLVIFTLFRSKKRQLPCFFFLSPPQLRCAIFLGLLTKAEFGDKIFSAI